MQLDISNCIPYIDILSIAMHLGVDYEIHFAGHSLFIIQIHLMNKKNEVYVFPGGNNHSVLLSEPTVAFHSQGYIIKM